MQTPLDLFAPPPIPKILVLDDDIGIQKITRLLLQRAGMDVDCAGDIPTASLLLAENSYDVAIVDIFISNKENGLDFLLSIQQRFRHIQVILITGQPELETARRAVRLGAYDYLAKPIDPQHLKSTVSHAVTHKRLLEDNEWQRTSLQAIFRSIPDGIVHVDKDMKLLQFNPSAVQMCGYSADDLFQQLETAQSGCGGGCRCIISDVLSDGIQRSCQRFPCESRANTQRLINIMVTPTVDDQGAIIGAVTVLRDDTALAALEIQAAGKIEYAGILGKSLLMQRMFSLIKALAKVQSTVLIEGESGTGKELVASALHNTGTRSDKPFIKVNCAALPEHLLESELFGHVRGAFTGAVANRQGRFEMAHGGTIFLDEIGDISHAMQVRLLRVLQEQEFEKVGDSSTIRVDVRVITATNQGLAEKVRQGEFRQDLYYRLNVVRISIPPLRERPEDIELLVWHFLELFGKKFNRPGVIITREAMQLLLDYSWPGNVRELEHCIEHALLMCHSSSISVDHLPDDITGGLQELPGDDNNSGISITDALVKTGGNKSKAARLLGISRMTLYRHLQESVPH